MLYTYEASDKKGNIIKGDFDAANKAAVIEHLERKRLIPVLIEEKIFKREDRGLSRKLFEEVVPIDLILLTRNLSATVRAGLSLVEGLDILIRDATKEVMRNILSEAKNNLEKGQPLSATFSSYKNIIPPVFIGMLRAGEGGGRLENALEELTRHLTREYNLAKKIKSALAYPFILLIGSIGVITLLIVFILPRLARTFALSGTKLPWLTQFFMDISKGLTWSPLLDVAVVALLAYLFLYFRKTDYGRRAFGVVVLKIPFAGELVKKVALVRLTRTLGSLVGSGMPIIDALALAADSASDASYKKAILESIEQVKNGVPFSKTLESRPKLFPNFLTSLISVGERTGTLEHILKTFADFYDDEVDNALKDLTTFLEPLLLLFMGVVIGLIALSVLLPIYQLVGKFS